MRETDILIAGGGLAGSTAAAMLGRAGYGVVLVDPHAVYPPDFRCEKIDGPQARVLRRTGLADAVLLDNMDLATLRQAVEMVAGRFALEASGGINLETIAEIAKTGVDYASSGWITHSAPNLDVALDIEM